MNQSYYMYVQYVIMENPRRPHLYSDHGHGWPWYVDQGCFTRFAQFRPPITPSFNGTHRPSKSVQAPLPGEKGPKATLRNASNSRVKNMRKKLGMKHLEMHPQ